MHNRKLLNLLARNAKKGEFRAETGDQGNIIYVYDVIVASDEDAAWFGGVSAESFVKALASMSGDVALRINSPGGDVFGAKAMAQAMREYDGTITAHVDGYAASAASHLVVNAAKRVMAPGSMLMIHKAWTIDIGNADDFTKTAELLNKIDGTIAADYAASATRSGKEPGDFAAMMAAETWFTPDEAIAAGLADEIAEAGPKNRVEWDLSAYDHAPRTQEQTALDELRAELAALKATLSPPADSEDEEDHEDPAELNEIEGARRKRIAALALRPAA